YSTSSPPRSKTTSSVCSATSRFSLIVARTRAVWRILATVGGPNQQTGPCRRPYVLRSLPRLLPSSNVIRVLVAALALAAALALPAGAVSKTAPATTATYRVTFTGSGGGRYLDVTRWLSDNGR